MGSSIVNFAQLFAVEFVAIDLPRTQLWNVWADGSNSRDVSPMTDRYDRLVRTCSAICSQIPVHNDDGRFEFADGIPTSSEVPRDRANTRLTVWSRFFVQQFKEVAISRHLIAAND